MMKCPRLNRPAYLALLAVIALLAVAYFPFSHTRAGNVGATILPSVAKPLVNLKNAQTPKLTYAGDAGAIASLQGGTATPTALASADFDSDGAMDVVVGYSTKNGGVLAVLRGNPNAYAPQDSSLYAKALHGSVPTTFLSKATVFTVPESPDFVATGDFNLDGHKDVLVGTRGNGLYLLPGDGRGNLLPAQAIPVAGQVTALDVTGDGHVAVALDGPNGAQLAILAPRSEGLAETSTYPLPAKGDTVAWGNLGSGTDIAVGAGANVTIIYGPLGTNPKTETVSLPFQVLRLALGDFIWDRDGRTEISVLADDGSIHILQHGTLDTRPLAAADAPGRRAALIARSKQPHNATSLGAWTVAQQLPFTGSAPSGSVSASAFSSPRLAAAPTHDLMVLDAGRSQLNILDTSGTAASPSAAVSFTGTPVAALALPQKINADRDIVVLTSSQAAPLLVTSPVSLTLNVTTTADEDSAGICTSSSTSIPSPLSLREAICIVNNSAAVTATINVPAGTYSLTSLETGELQVGFTSGANISIIGAGATSTIIQQTDGSDRLIEVDPFLAGNIPFAVSNLTLTGGNCTNLSHDCGYGAGAILAGGVAGDNLTLTNVIISNNSTAPNSGDDGGGVAFTGPNMTVTNSTFSSNTAYSEPTASGSVGGAFWFESNPDQPGNLVVTNSTFTNNVVTSGAPTFSAEGGALSITPNAGNTATITGSTFTGNQAQGSTGIGGAIYADGAISVSNSRFTGNTAVTGGGYVETGGAGNVATVTDNWWGCNGGPGASGCDTVSTDGTGSTLNFNPWLVLSISASSTQVNPNGTSNLSADLTHNSSSTGGFSVPNGTAVVFGATLGTANPTNTTLTGGQAGSVFTAGVTTGAGSGTATVDNQIVSVTINIGAPPAITSAASTTFTVGASGSFTVTTTGAPTPSIGESGTLPSGVGFHDNGNGTATLSGTPAPGTGGIYSLTITAQNGVLPNASQSFTLTVDQAPAITSANSTTFTNNTAGTFTVTSTGFPTATLNESGTLPTGVTFTANNNGTGTLAGTPTQSGVFNISFTANNGVSPNAVQSFTLTVNPQQYVLTTSANPANGGTVTPPSGGSYNAGTAVPITATPAAGFAFVNWTSSPDSVGNPNSPSTTITMNAAESVTANFQAFATPVPTTTTVASSLNPSFTSAPNNSVAFTATVTYNSGTPVTSGTVSFTDNGNPIAGGTGLPLNGSGQALVITSFTVEGTHTILATYSGYSSLSISFLGSSGFVDQEVDNHTVQNGNQFCNPGAITIPNASGAAMPYPSRVFVTGESGNIADVTVTLNNISSSNMPPTDLLLVGPTGAAIIPFASVGDGSTISGVNITLDDAAASLLPGGSPLTTGTFKPTSLTGSTSLVFPAPAPLVNASDYAATDGSATLASQFGNTAPNGTWQLFAMASSANGAATIGGGWCVTIIASTAPAITSASSTIFGVGVANSFTVTTTGSPTPSLSESGTLPSGVSFVDNHNGTGTLSGTPTSGGTFPITFTATNGVGSPAVQNFTLSVSQAPAITSANNATFVAGSANSFMVTTTGSPTPTLSESGTLPTGVSFVDNHNGTGTLSGTPTTTGVFGITFTASNGVGSPVMQSFTLTVDQAPAITSMNSTTFAIDVAGSFTVTSTGFPTPSLSESGTLPTGVSFVDNHNGTGTLSGTPTMSGTFPITFSASNGVGSPFVQNFTLTVSGGPLATLTPSSINFGTVYLYNVRLQGITLKNTGTATLAISNISLTLGNGTNRDDYTFANLCPRMLAAGKSCNIGIIFYAGNIGTLSATLNVTDNAPGSPQQVNMTANVINPQAGYNPSFLNFGNVHVGNSVTKNVTLTNTGTTMLDITSIGVTGANSADFTETNACPSTLNPAANCVISVKFTPSTTGNRSANLTVVDNAESKKQNVPLSGKGN